MWAIVLFLLASSAPARPPASPLRVLFLGNSLTYTNDVPGLVEGLAGVAGIPFTRNQIANPGWNLELHATHSLPVVDSGNYDIVVLQQYSTGNVIEQDASVQILNSHALAAGARSLFFNTPSWDFGPSDTDLAQFLQQTALIRYNYAIEGALHNIAISPTGLAWRRVRLDRPDIGMYAPDGHPSLAGSYLMACVHYASLFCRVSVGNSYTAGLAPADAAYLQSVADDAVLQNPWAVDLYGYGPNHFYWAKDWNQYASDTNSMLRGVLISGAGSQSSPAVKVDSAVGQAGSVYLGVLDNTYATPGDGRLYLFPGGSLQATGDVVVGKEGSGSVAHRGGTLHAEGSLVLAEQAGSAGRYVFSGGVLAASQIVAGGGVASFVCTGGWLSFHEYGSAAIPLTLHHQGGVLAANAFPGGTLIHGDFIQSSGASLERVAAATGTFEITGTATIAGSLFVSYAPGFHPARGWSCAILSAAQLAGTFLQVTLPPMTDDGVLLSIAYSPTAVVVAATQDTTDTDANGLPDWWERRVFGVATSGKAWAGDFQDSGASNGVVFSIAGELMPNPLDGYPRIEILEGQPLLRFMQRIGGSGAPGVDYAVDGVRYTIEVRSDPAGGAWQSGSDLVELVSRADNGNGTETIFLRLLTPAGSQAGRRFARLVVARQ